MVDLTDSWARQFFLEGRFAPDFFEIASFLVPNRGVFFDVGANFGWCSFGLFGVRPQDDIRYYLFEANPAILECIRESMARNSPGDFQLAHGCVMDRMGYSSFEFDTEHTGGSHYTGPSDTGVANIILDQFIADHDIPAVDLMKIDVEGSELLALEGARRSLAKGLIKAIYVEVSSENLERQGFKPSELLQLLRGYGFSTFWCRPFDFETFPELIRSSVTVKSDHGSIMVSPLDIYPENHQSDVLAIHRDTPLLAEIFNRLSDNTSSGSSSR